MINWYDRKRLETEHKITSQSTGLRYNETRKKTREKAYDHKKECFVVFNQIDFAVRIRTKNRDRASFYASWGFRHRCAHLGTHELLFDRCTNSFTRLARHSLHQRVEPGSLILQNSFTLVKTFQQEFFLNSLTVDNWDRFRVRCYYNIFCWLFPLYHLKNYWQIIKLPVITFLYENLTEFVTKMSRIVIEIYLHFLKLFLERKSLKMWKLHPGYCLKSLLGFYVFQY